MNSLIELPCWYIWLGFFWSTYQGIRGVVEQSLAHHGKVFQEANNKWRLPRDPSWKPWQKWLVLYVHDFAFRFICTATGFFVLYLAVVIIGGDINNIKCLSPSASTLLAFLFLLGIIGVGGQLHYVILMGKVPR